MLLALTACDRTSKPTATRYQFTLIGNSEGATIEVDGSTGVVVVSGAQVGPQSFLVHGDRLLVPTQLLDSNDESRTWTSFEVGRVLGDGSVFSPEELATYFDLDAKECVLPSIEADAVIKLLLTQEFAAGEDRTRYNICGSGIIGGPFADGTGVSVLRSTVPVDSLRIPEPSDVVESECLGAKGDQLLLLVREAFATS